MIPAPAPLRNRHTANRPGRRAHRSPPLAGAPPGTKVSQVSVVGPVLLLVLGSLLGAATQTASSADMGLRVPSLFAALLMVAQGLLELERARRERARKPEQKVAVVTTAGEAGAARAGYQTAQPPATTPVRLVIPVSLMALASWLGLAVLTSGGEAVALSVLATISAFLLFALGWQVLLGSR